MITKINKITDATAVLLVDSTDNVGATYISLANIHSTDAADVDLYLTDNDSISYYIFKNVNIPSGASLVVDGLDLDFDKELYSLYIKLASGSSTVDVITRY